MAELSSIFRNGGPNYSFGRVFSGLALTVGLSIVAYAALTDQTAYQMSRYDATSKSTYVVTELHRKVDGANLQSLFIGIATLAGAVYGMSKLGTAASTYAENSGTGGSGTSTTNSSTTTTRD